LFLNTYTTTTIITTTITTTIAIEFSPVAVVLTLYIKANNKIYINETI